MEPSRAAPLPQLRLIALSAVFTLGAVFGLLALMGQRFTEAGTLWIALPLVLGVADLVLVPAVGSSVRPLPHAATPEEARRIAGGVMRTVTYLRLALVEAPALFGLVASLVAASLVPYAIGFAFAVPLLLVFVYPRTQVVDGVRQRLESGGVSSGL